MVPTEPERERLLSVLMTVRSISIPHTGHVEQLRIMLNSTVDFSQRVFGLDSKDNPSVSAEYESLIFRKTAENIKYKDVMKLNQLIEETLLNANFASMTKMDQRNTRIVFAEIK